MSWPLTLLVYFVFSMVLAAPAEGATVRDEFGSIAYNGNCMRIGWADADNMSKWLQREADLTGATTATFAYDVTGSSEVRGWVDIKVRVGGGVDSSHFLRSEYRWGTNRDHSPGSNEQFRGFFHFDNIKILTDSADPVTTSTQFTYNLTTTINGVNAGTNVTLVDTLPGTIASAANATVAILVISPSTIGLINNSATISMDQGDSNPSNDTDSELTNIITAVGSTTDTSPCGDQENDAYKITLMVTGIDFALNFLGGGSGGVTARHELGSATGGVFTSFGFADEGPHEPQAKRVTDLSAISGTAPAGPHLALRIVPSRPMAR